MSDKKKKKKKEKEEKSVWAAEVMRFMENSMKAAMDAALDEIFKDWK